MENFLYNPPVLVYVLLALALLGLIAHRAREALNPVLKAVLGGVAANAGSYWKDYCRCALLATMASTGAFIDICTNLTPADVKAMAWWNLLALVAKVVSPGIATIIAYTQVPTGPLQPKSTLSAPPFPPSNPTPP